MAAYTRGPVTTIESSSSLVPSNLSVVPVADGQDATEWGPFCVIHKHIAVVAKPGSSLESQRVVCYGKVEDKNASYLTQVSVYKQWWHRCQWFPISRLDGADWMMLWSC